jgi:GNAT superfamily N-acetyltransferase
VTGFEIERLPIPQTLDGEGGTDFAESVEARNASEVEAYGTTEVAYPPAELLPYWHDPNEPKVLWGARVDGRIVARAVHEWQLDDDSVGWMDLQVHPDFRGRGIGRVLADTVEEHARSLGRSRLITYSAAAEGPGERLVPPTGAGSVPAGSREARFLLARGWRLEQIARGSRFPLPFDPADIGARRAEAERHAGDAYRIHTWAGPTPERWLADQAMLNTRMSTEAPSAGLEEPEDHWDADRVREYDALQDAGPRKTLTAAAEHVPSSTLAAFTQLAAPADLGRPVTQEDTLVLREHRGHRLGMLLKVANLQFLEEMAPGHPCVLTWNAEENRAMLDVNEAVGFVPIGYEGAWRKDL